MDALLLFSVFFGKVFEIEQVNYVYMIVCPMNVPVNDVHIKA